MAPSKQNRSDTQNGTASKTNQNGRSATSCCVVQCLAGSQTLLPFKSAQSMATTSKDSLSLFLASSILTVTTSSKSTSQPILQLLPRLLWSPAAHGILKYLRSHQYQQLRRVQNRKRNLQNYKILLISRIIVYPLCHQNLVIISTLRTLQWLALRSCQNPNSSSMCVSGITNPATSPSKSVPLSTKRIASPVDTEQDGTSRMPVRLL